MEKSQLLTVLRTCSKRELREISRWLRSPSHNLRQDIVAFFDWLNENGRLEQPVEKETFWPVLFPNEPFDDARMRQLMYFLLKSIEDFLVWEELTKDDVRKIAALASVYRRRQLEKPFRQSLENAKRAAHASPFRNSVHLQNGFNLEMEEYKYLTSLKGNTRFNLREVSDSLDLAFVAQKLRISSLMLSHQAVYKAEYDAGLLDDVLRFVETKNLLDSPAIATYYYCVKTLTEKKDETNFEKLEHHLYEHGGLFPINELREVFLFALNFCVSRINAGQEIYLRKALGLYKRGFEQRILHEDGFISGKTFVNAVQIALKLHEFEWVERFIKDFQLFIEEKQRVSVVNFLLSRLHFERGEYDMAMQLMHGFEYDDLLWNLIAKIMLLKIYFEYRFFDALESHIDALRAYLQRKEILGYHKSNYKNIISLTRKLLHLAPNSLHQKERLRLLITNTNPLTERDWLLAQIDKIH